MGPTLLPEALRKLRAATSAPNAMFSSATITRGEAEALLDALDLISRVVDVSDIMDDMGEDLATLLVEARDAIEASR